MTESIEIFINYKKAEIDEMLSRLQTLSNNNFGMNPDDVKWGQASTVGRYAVLLKQITDMAFKEGEYAE